MSSVTNVDPFIGSVTVGIGNSGELDPGCEVKKSVVSMGINDVLSTMVESNVTDGVMTVCVSGCPAKKLKSLKVSSLFHFC